MTNNFDDEKSLYDEDDRKLTQEDFLDDDNIHNSTSDEEYINVDDLYDVENYDEYSNVVDDLYKSAGSINDHNQGAVVGNNSVYFDEHDTEDVSYEAGVDDEENVINEETMSDEESVVDEEINNSGGEFDYMSYMSTPKSIESNGSNENVEEEEKLKDNKEGSKVFVAVVVSVLISALVSVGVCLGFVFGMPYLKKIAGIEQSQEVFTTRKMVTIENKSNELVAEIAEKVSPSIVCIKETVLARDFWFGVTEAKGHGSGIIFREDGYILTNNHVIEGALENNTNNIAKGCKIEVVLPSSKNNETYEAKIIGRDPKTDLAVIKIEKTGLLAANFGDSDKLRVGETAVAIGNPYSLEFMGTVTSGVISGLNRTIQSEDGRQFKLIQTDAAINSGNSGGALVNSKGEVIGINTLKLVDSGIEGLSFAVPSNTAKEIADSLVEYKYVKGRPLIGIIIDPRYTEALAKRHNMPAGVYVYNVDLLSAAHKAGIEVGDVITEFAGVAVKDINQLNSEKDKYKAGDEVTIKLYKTSNGKTKIVKLKLGEDVGTNS